MAHIGKDALNSKKDWWIEIDFTQTHEVYQVILKRRGDALKSYKDRTNPTIWIQYQDPDDNKWKWYPHNNGVASTGETPDTDPEAETKINLIPFKARGVAIWFPYNKQQPVVAARCDVLVSKPEPEGAEPPAEAKRALMDLGSSYELRSWANYWSWKNPRLDAEYGAMNNQKDRDDKNPYWVEIDFQQPATVYQVITKKRGDNNKATYGAPWLEHLANQQIQHIKVQYKDVDDGKWKFYKNGKILSTG